MKREFKFRSWIISQKKMIKVFGFNEHLVFEQTWDSPSIKENIFEIEDCVLMQFTGVKDAKGNEIYEGDILGRTTIPDRYVSFENGSFITNKPHIPNYKPIILIDGFDVVIGNIFENPEMLPLQVEEAGR